MHIRDDFPHDVQVTENVFIPMRDGARLAARIWRPEATEQRPLPAILEYIPYRKRDFTRVRDAVNHPYLAGHGYVSVRVDMRGSGDSDGVLTDEYRPQEQDDAEDVIAWLADQPWCDGNVGMMGISWGGFNALQVAARRPPALKAIISLSASDDIYIDNMHYMGGCLLGDNLSEATVMFAFNSLPPDPAIVGPRWREMWRERLEGSGLWVESWLEHQRRDAYWRSASVREDYEAIQCPVFAIGGWADGYTNAILRLLSNLHGPRMGLIGPWGHKYPHMGIPGPAIGFLQEALRWWDHWLKDIDTGIMDEPMLRAWMQDSVAPETAYDERPGHWVGESSWPSEQVAYRRFGLTHHHLAEDTSDEPPSRHGHEGPEVSVQSPLSVGLYAGKWASYAAPPDLPHDQREEDGGALTFETHDLAHPLVILGQPEAVLQVSIDRPVGMIAARLSDVAPDGQATRITYGLLNLTHRASNEEPEPMEPGKPYEVTVPLNGLGHVVPAGHRLRLSLSTSYWPLAWPPPQPTTLTVNTGHSELRLPVRERADEASDIGLGFDEPQGAPPLDVTLLEPGEHHRRVIRDLATNESTLEIVKDQGSFRIEDTDTVLTSSTTEHYRLTANDVTSANGETRTRRRIEREGWGVEVRTRTLLTCTQDTFRLHAELDAFECDAERGDLRVFADTWTREIARDLV